MMMGRNAAAVLILLTLTTCQAPSRPTPLSAACGERRPAQTAAGDADWSLCGDEKWGWLIEQFGSTVSRAQKRSASNTMVSLQQYRGGTFLAPITINDRLTLMFMVDSGASDVSIPADVVLTLLRTGTLTDDDFLGPTTYTLGDGSTVPSQTFRIRSIRVGDRVIENVVGSVVPPEASPLLGQSFLGRFRSWSIDNNKRVLMLEE